MEKKIDVSIVVVNNFFINCLILNDVSVNGVSWQMTLVYGPPIPSLKPNFWDDINKIGDSFDMGSG